MSSISNELPESLLDTFSIAKDPMLLDADSKDWSESLLRTRHFVGFVMLCFVCLFVLGFYGPVIF